MLKVFNSNNLLQKNKVISYTTVGNTECCKIVLIWK